MLRFKPTELKEGALKFWHIPQIPGKAFEVYIDTLEEGADLQELLARYDDFQFKNNIKPDYSNGNGIVVLETGKPMDEKEAEKNKADGVPDGLCWFDVDASERCEEWEALKASRKETI